MLRSNSDTKYHLEKEKIDNASYNFKKLKYDNIFKTDAEKRSPLRKRLTPTKKKILFNYKESSSSNSKDFKKHSSSRSDSNFPNDYTSDNSYNKFSSGNSQGTCSSAERFKFKEDTSENVFQVKKNYFAEFFKYIKIIYCFKTDIDKIYLKKIQEEITEAHIHLEILKEKIKIELEKDIYLDSKTEEIKNLLKELMEIIDIIASISSNNFYPDIKTKIALVTKHISNKIKNIPDSNKEKLSSFCFLLFYSLSPVLNWIDYYSNSINCFVEKMNRYFIRFIKNIQTNLNFLLEKDEKYFLPLSFIEKYLDIKGIYLKEFCSQSKYQENFMNSELLQKYCYTIKTNVNLQRSFPTSLKTKNPSNEKPSDKLFSYDKFSSFGIFFFKNIFHIIDSMNFVFKYEKNKSMIDPTENSRRKNPTNYIKNTFCSQTKLSHIQKKINSTILIKLENLTKYYLNRKLITWKSTAIISDKSSKIPEEKCRICRTNFTLDKFVIHSYYCKERSVYINSYSKTTFNIGILVKHLQEAKSKLNSGSKFKPSINLSFTPKREQNLENILFSPYNTYKKLIIDHLDKNLPKTENELSKYNFNNCTDLFDCFLTFLSRRKSPEIYEINPAKLIYTNSLVHFLMTILCKKENFKLIKNYLEIFIELFIDLMQEGHIIENLITLNSKFNNKIKSSYDFENKSSAGSNSSSVDLKTEISNFIAKFNQKYFVKSSMVVTDKKKIPHSNSGLLFNENKDCILSTNPPRKSCSGIQNFNKENQSILSNSESISPLNDKNVLENKTHMPKTSLFNKPLQSRKESIKNISKGLKFVESFPKDDKSLKLFSQNVRDSSVNKFDEQEEYEGLTIKSQKKEKSPQDRIVYVDENRKKSSLEKNIEDNYDQDSKSPIDLDKKQKIHLKLFREKRKKNRNNFINLHEQDCMEDSKIFRRPRSIIKHKQHPTLILCQAKPRSFSMDINDNKYLKKPKFNPVLNPIRIRTISNDSNSNKCSDSFVDEKDDRDSLDAQNLEKESQLNELFEIIDEMRNMVEDSTSKSLNTTKKISIDDFKILSLIGKGGYGHVYLAKKKDTGDVFAIKQVNLSKIETKNKNRMLKRETEILNEINHDFLVKCYYIFADNKNYYIIMEYLAGGDLSNLMDDVKVIPPNIIKQIAVEVILALEHLHSKGIIHKDIKPENVLIANNGHFKLADFGLSEISFKQNKFAVSIIDTANDEQTLKRETLLDLNTKTEIFDDNSDDGEEICIKKNHERDHSLKILKHKSANCEKHKKNDSQFFSMSIKHNRNIKSSMFVKKNTIKSFSMNLEKIKIKFDSNQNVIQVNIPGTPNYTAPEIIKGKPTTGAVDLWALGVILYELFTGKQPFMEENREKIYENILNLNVDWDLLKKCLREDQAAFEFVHSLLVLDPDKRLHDYEEIKSHPYFEDVSWNDVNSSDIRYIKGYVQKKIKILNNSKNTNVNEFDISHKNIEKNSENIFLTERVDNLHVINMKEWKKKANLDIELYDVKDYLQDFM